jgi:uncharacterized RDD family membrane protein YckC
MPISSISRRFAAMLIDGIIICIPVAIAAHVIPILGGLVLLFLYYPVFESSRIQATIGKHLMGIQVSSLSGGRIGFKDACLRLLIKLVSTIFLFLGHFLAFFTEQKRAAHDLIAQTVVVYGRAETSLADAWAEQLRNVFSS